MRFLMVTVIALLMICDCATAQPAPKDVDAKARVERRLPGSHSIVVFQREKPEFDEDRIAKAVKAGLDLKKDPLWIPPPPGHERYIRMFFHEGSIYVVYMADVPVGERSRLEPMAQSLDSEVARKVVLEHRGWIAVERAEAEDEPKMTEQQWRTVARIAGQMLDERSMLMLAAKNHLALVTPKSKEQLLGAEWMDALEGEAAVKPRAAIKADDPALREAEKMARDTLSEFRKAWEERGKGQSFLVKARFAEDEVVEHMWVQITSLDGPSFLGVLLSRPGEIKNVKQRDAVTVKESDVGDWVIREKGKPMRGGYTVKLIEERAKERR